MESKNYGKIANIDEEVRVVQYGEGFSFDFIKESKERVSITPQEDFIRTNTMSGEDLLIFRKDAFEFITGLCHYQSDIYIRGKNIDNHVCVGLRFTGGILARLFIPNKLEVDMENGEYRIKCRDDSIEHILTVEDKEIHLRIESHITEKHGISGSSLNNTVTGMEVIIPSGIGMNEVVPLYNAVLKMCQFLSFRKNIAFDEVALLNYEVFDGHKFATDYAELYILNRFKSHTDKEWFCCISFENLGEAIVPLLRQFTRRRKKDLTFR